MDILQFAQQRVLEQQGRSVVRCLLHATKIAPDSPHAWQLLAHVHMNEMGRPAEAVKYLRGAIKAAPATVDYWLALAQARAHTPHTMHAHRSHIPSDGSRVAVRPARRRGSTRRRWGRSTSTSGSRARCALCTHAHAHTHMAYAHMEQTTQTRSCHDGSAVSRC